MITGFKRIVIDGVKSKYLVNKKGQVYSEKKNIIMKSGDNGKGYRLVHLTVSNKRIVRYIHRLVAEYFIENPENKKCVNHKDFDKSNNDISNLEWVTYKENTNHAYMAGVIKDPPKYSGEDHPTSKLDVTRVQIARYCYPKFTVKEISTALGLSWSTIDLVVKNKTWTNIKDKE